MDVTSTLTIRERIVADLSVRHWEDVLDTRNPVVTKGHHHYRRERYLKDLIREIIKSELTSERTKIREMVAEELKQLYWCKEHSAMCDHAFDFCGLTDYITALQAGDNK